MLRLHESHSNSFMETTVVSEQHRQGDFLRIPQVRTSSSIAYLVVNCFIPGSLQKLRKMVKW